LGSREHSHSCSPPNSATNQIEVYNSSFKLIKTFADTKLSGLKVYGVSVLKVLVYVTLSGSTTGAVDIFTTAGKFVKTLIAPTSTLRGPWGLAIAPSSFETLSGSLLVGNVDDGKIHGFNLTTGKLIGAIKDTTGKVISIPGLWALLFGGGTATNGKTDQLFFAAGTDGYATGEFGVITP
jgi:uncharacterized protein (TIGR03118 family)